MKNFILSFIFTFLVVSAYVCGEVVHAPHLGIVEKYIDDLDENALVVFDVDYTILVPNDRILAPCGEEYCQKFMKILREMQEKGEILGSQVTIQAQTSLVDNKILHLLEKLKEKNIKVIALTAMSTGQFGVIPNMEQWRIEQLASLGIHLDGAFPEVDMIMLEEFEGAKGLPVFKKGILASSKYPKGQVLCAFLKRMEWKPSKVLFIDDRMYFIDSVEYELEKENIPHTSFHYTAAIDSLHSLDHRLADFQFDYLLHQGKWLNDEEAKNKMEIEANDSMKE